MKVRFSALLALGALAVSAPAAFGQLTTEVLNVSGITHGVTAKFTFIVNPTNNTLTINVDNTIVGEDDMRGTITSFGFNTPFTDRQLGRDGSKVQFTQTWTKENPRRDMDGVKWSKFEPYHLPQGGGTDMDLGVGTNSSGPSGGNTGRGIKHGEKATFVFTFPEFDVTQSASFFNEEKDLVVRWQEVGSENCTEWSDYGWSDVPTGEIPPTPEPATYGLMGAAALVGMVAYRRRTKASAQK